MGQHVVDAQGCGHERNDDPMDFGLRGTKYEQLEALFEKLGNHMLSGASMNEAQAVINGI